MRTHDTAAPHSHGTARSAEDRTRLGRRAQLLAGVSVAYNGIEAVIAIAAGLVAGSVALVGFGLDSIAIRGPGPGVSHGLSVLGRPAASMSRPATRHVRAIRGPGPARRS